MSDYQSRAGGVPTLSRTLVNVDNLTMFGNGAIDAPLRAAGGAGGAPQYLAVTSSTGIANGTAPTTFVSYAGLPHEGPATETITLEDGLEDGFAKIVTFTAALNTEWVLEPTNFLSGTSITFAAGGAARLIWDATQAGWILASMQGGVLA